MNYLICGIVMFLIGLAFGIAVESDKIDGARQAAHEANERRLVAESSRNMCQRYVDSLPHWEPTLDGGYVLKAGRPW